jgi:hypothetical protein
MRLFSNISAAVLGLGLVAACGPANDPNPNPNPNPNPTPDNTCAPGGEVDIEIPRVAAVTQEGEVPDFSCVGNPEVLGPATNVLLEGCVDIFGIGGKAKPGLKIAIYDVDQNPQDDVPAYGEAEVAVRSQAGPLQDRAAECSKEGFYQLDGVPTNTPLIVKLFDTDEGQAQTAIPTYSYFVYFSDDEIVDGVIDYEANLVYKTTYDSIPTLGGKRVEGQEIIFDGVGRSVIAGEIHDCQDRLVANVAVSSSEFDASSKMAYFNGDTEDPTPDLTLNATNDDALYVVLNAKTDPGSNIHTIAAAYVDADCTGDDCLCQDAGSADVYVFPDSVTIMTLKGAFPVAQ